MCERECVHRQTSRKQSPSKRKKKIADKRRPGVVTGRARARAEGVVPSGRSRGRPMRDKVKIVSLADDGRDHAAVEGEVEADERGTGGAERWYF